MTHPFPIVVTRLDIEPARLKPLQEMLAGPAYQLLREIIASRCVEHQVEASNRQLFPENPAAVKAGEEHLANAKELYSVLQTLDELQDPKAWFLAKLDYAR